MAGKRTAKVANPNASLVLAAWNEDLHGVRTAIAAGADVNYAHPDATDGMPALSTALHHAACNRKDAAMATLLLEKGADVNAVDAAGNTPAIRAARFGGVQHPDLSYHILGLLLKKKPDMGKSDVDGKTALHHACVKLVGDDYVRMLIDAGGDPCARDSTGNTPLHLAAAGRHKGILRIMIAKRADPKMANADGDTPMHLLFGTGAWLEHAIPDCLATLLEAGADPGVSNRNGVSPKDLACGRTGEQVLAAWSAKAAVSEAVAKAHRSTAVEASQVRERAVAERKTVDMVRVENPQWFNIVRVLERSEMMEDHYAYLERKFAGGLSPNAFGDSGRKVETLADVCLRNKREDALLLLFERSPNLSHVTDRALAACLWSGRLVESLLANGHEVSELVVARKDDGGEPVHDGNLATAPLRALRALIRHGLDINVPIGNMAIMDIYRRNLGGRSTRIVMSAAMELDVDCAVALMRMGAMTDGPGFRDGASLLGVAVAQAKSPDLIPERSGLGAAKFHRFVEAVALEGHDVDALDVNGETALHIAARMNLADRAGALLAHGANPDIRNHGGKTPEEVAQEDARPEIAALAAAWRARRAMTDVVGRARAQPPAGQGTGD